MEHGREHSPPASSAQTPSVTFSVHRQMAELISKEPLPEPRPPTPVVWGSFSLERPIGRVCPPVFGQIASLGAQQSTVDL